MPQIESGGERPTFQPVKEFSPYLSNALKESGVRFEELLFAQHELIIATSVETAELLTVDSDLHRKKINELINQVVAEKATPFDPDGKSNDIDIELYSVLTDLGKKEQLEQFSVWEWYILERTSFEVVEHFNEPLSASAYYVSALDILPPKKQQLLDDAIAAGVGNRLQESDVGGYNMIFNFVIDENRDQYLREYIPQLMANYWVQNPAQNEVWVKLNRRDVDYYQAAVEFITEQAHVPDKPYYDNIVLSVAPAVNAKLNEYGFSLANYLFHEDENDNTIVYKGLPPILFTVDWFADCMNGTLDEMANTREAAGQDGIDHKEEMKSYGPYIKALGMDPSILTVDALTIKDISEEIVDKNVFAWKDDARRKWEELAKFGAIEKLYGARGWDIAILSITFDIATELVRRKQPKKNIWGIEDQPDLWKSIVTAAREKAVQLLNTPDIAALRSGSMSPEDYTRMYLEETERHEKPQRPSFSRLVRDDPFMKHDPDDKRPWMVKGDE